MNMIRKYGIWIALLLTLVATKWASEQDTTDELKHATSSNEANINRRKLHSKIENKNTVSSTNDPAVQTTGNGLLLRKLDNEVIHNIFSPLVIQNSNLASSTTSTPINPFIYAGKIVEDGSIVVFLLDGEKSHAVKSGDVIEDTWKVKSINPPNMIIRNIPQKIDMKIEIGVNS